MAKRVLSIVIGTEATKVCEVSYKKNFKNKGIRVYRSISFPTPPNTIEDGYIKDRNIFGDELRSQLKANKFKADKVIFSISSSKIANREVILPPMKERKIADIINTGASDYFPIDVKEYILSYLILEKNTSSRKEKAAKRKLDKKEAKLAKKLDQQNRKSHKKKSKTEIIADNMELMEANANNSEFEAQKEASGGARRKKQMRLNVYAVPSTLVKNYYNFAKQMHFDIVSLDYSGNSSYQIIKRQVNRGTNVFIQLNEQDTLISILSNDVLILQRNVNYGISTLIEAVMEQEYFGVKTKEEALELLSKKNLLNLEKERVEAVQFDSSWSKGEVAAASEYVRAAGAPIHIAGDEELEARRNVIDSLHYLTNSIARMLDYYKSNHKNVEFDSIFLSGTGVRIQGIDQFFSSGIGINHKKMQKLWTVSAKKKAKQYRSNPSEFISCIGAVLKPIDFIPAEYLQKKQKRSAILATIVFASACIIGSAGTIYVSYTDYMTAQGQLDQVNSQMASMPQLSGAQSEYDDAVKNLEDLQKLEQMTESKNDNIKSVIEELEKKLPTGTVIHTMQFSETGVTMSVTANDDKAGANALVAKLLIQLKAIEYFKTVDVSGISSEEENGVSKVTFSISCTYQ